jgi:predicted RNase H-like nuclease (RuvC/YqgF family)
VISINVCRNIDDQNADAKSNMRSVKTSKTAISNLEKQLQEEKVARLKLKDEIDELKKMN